MNTNNDKLFVFWKVDQVDIVLRFGHATSCLASLPKYLQDIQSSVVVNDKTQQFFITWFCNVEEIEVVVEKVKISQTYRKKCWLFCHFTRDFLLITVFRNLCIETSQ